MWCRPGLSRLQGNLSSSTVGNLLTCWLVQIFADDCLLYRSINKVEDTAALQNDMSALQQWESDWQMMFHPEKCTTCTDGVVLPPGCSGFCKAVLIYFWLYVLLVCPIVVVAAFWQQILGLCWNNPPE
jgi:hypothetical protein